MDCPIESYTVVSWPWQDSCGEMGALGWSQQDGLCELVVASCPLSKCINLRFYFNRQPLDNHSYYVELSHVKLSCGELGQS